MSERLRPQRCRIIWKKGIAHVRDPIRNLLLRATHEERARQAVVSWLIRSKSWPSRRISTEYNLLRDRLGRGRIDIALMRPATPKERGVDPGAENVFVGVVEVKRAGNLLADHVVDQALKYAEAIQARFVGVTNGRDFYTLEREPQKKNYVNKQRFPTYGQILRNESLPPEPPADPFVRPSWAQLNDPSFLRRET